MAIKENQVHIDFTYDSLPPGIYTLQMPEKDGTGICKVFNKTPPQMNLEREETVTFKYNIPLSSTDVLMDWMLGLEGNGEKVNPSYTLILEDYNNLESTWVAPASDSVVTFAEEKSISASTRNDLKNFLSVTEPAIPKLDRPEVLIMEEYMATTGHDSQGIRSGIHLFSFKRNRKCGKFMGSRGH